MIWIYEQYPFTQKKDHRKTSYEHYRDLTMGLAEEYYASHLRMPFYTTHYYHGRWKIDVINKLRKSMNIDVDQLLLTEESAEYGFRFKRRRNY